MKKLLSNGRVYVAGDFCHCGGAIYWRRRRRGGEEKEEGKGETEGGKEKEEKVEGDCEEAAL